MNENKRFPLEKIAKLDSEERKKLQPATNLVELVTKWQPRVIIDIGVGTGYFSLPLAQKLSNSKIIGVDVEPKMIEVFEKRAKQAKLKNVQAIQAKPDGIPLNPNSADLILMCNLYHELDNRETYLNEVSRVLTKGGRVLICDWPKDQALEAGPPSEHRVAASLVEQELKNTKFTEVTSHLIYDSFYVLSGSFGNHV